MLKKKRESDKQSESEKDGKGYRTCEITKDRGNTGGKRKGEGERVKWKL